MRGKRANAGHQEIIIKRRSRKGGHEAHGGAWKVAFADFAVAMMALFMVLWVITPQKPEFHPSYGNEQSNPVLDGGAGVFENNNPNPIEFDGVHTRKDFDTHAVLGPESTQVEQAQASSAEQSLDHQGAGSGDGLRHYNSQVDLQELAALVREVSGQVDALANIAVDVVPQGLRILIKDDQQRFMFARGSAQLDPHFHKLLGALAQVLAKVDNKLIISGHTDSARYRGESGYNNWNLSGDRALRARNVLVQAGLPVAGVLQVAAQADVMPLYPDDPLSGANRRIELLLLTKRAEQLYRELFGEGQISARYTNQGVELIEPSAGTDDQSAPIEQAPL